MFKNYIVTCLLGAVCSLSYGQDNSANHENYLSNFPIIDMHFHSDWWGASEVEETLSGRFLRLSKEEIKKDKRATEDTGRSDTK
jgi:hypothetical protein